MIIYLLSIQETPVFSMFAATHFSAMPFVTSSCLPNILCLLPSFLPSFLPFFFFLISHLSGRIYWFGFVNFPKTMTYSFWTFHWYCTPQSMAIRIISTHWKINISFSLVYLSSFLYVSLYLYLLFLITAV